MVLLVFHVFLVMGFDTISCVSRIRVMGLCVCGIRVLGSTPLMKLMGRNYG